jgi:hypothetical protein
MRSATPLALALATLLAVGCDDDAPPPLVLGEAVPVLTEEVPPTGATLRVEEGALAGLELEIPDGAHASATSVAIGYHDILEHDLGEAVPLSPLLTIEDGGAYADRPMRLTVPIELPPDHFAMGFVYDRETGDLEALPLLGLSETSVTVLTRHFSDVLIAAIVQASLELGVIETPFTRGVDTWQFGNFGSHLSPGGNCAGMSIAAMHAFHRASRDPVNTPPLYDRYDGIGDRETPGFTEDDADARRFVSVVQQRTYGSPTRRTWEGQLGSASEATHYYALAFAMAMSEQPQYLSIQGGGSGHALVATRIFNGIDPAGDRVRAIEVYDSNFPFALGVEPPHVAYSVEDGTFADYRQPDRTYSSFYFIGRSALVDWSILGPLWEQLEDGTIGDAEFPAYSLAWANLSDDEETGTVRSGQLIQTEAADLAFRLDAPFEGAVRLYDEDGGFIAAIATAPPVFPFPLVVGDNRLGVQVESLIGGQPTYVDFAWIDVERLEATGPTTVRIPDFAELHSIDLTFPDGQGTAYERIPEEELGFSVYGNGTLLDVVLGGYPGNPEAWPVEEVPVQVAVEGAGPLSWRIYSAANAYDPASRHTARYWEDTDEAIPMRGDLFYWLTIYPETGPYHQEVLRLRGGAPP